MAARFLQLLEHCPQLVCFAPVDISLFHSAFVALCRVLKAAVPLGSLTVSTLTRCEQENSVSDLVGREDFGKGSAKDRAQLLLGL